MPNIYLSIEDINELDAKRGSRSGNVSRILRTYREIIETNKPDLSLGEWALIRGAIDRHGVPDSHELLAAIVRLAPSELEEEHNISCLQLADDIQELSISGRYAVIEEVCRSDV